MATNTITVTSNRRRTAGPYRPAAGRPSR
jgi:hypothetical protein